MDDFFICDTCIEDYDARNRCPRMLVCGHSFCSTCIQKLLATRLFCPTCKTPIEKDNLESIPVNYILKQMVEQSQIHSNIAVISSIQRKWRYQINNTNSGSIKDLNSIDNRITDLISVLENFVKDMKRSKLSVIQKKDLLNNEKLREFISSGSKILITITEAGLTKYGLLTVEEGALRIHCMQQDPLPPSPVCLTLDNCLTTLTGGIEWPQKIFLQFSSNDVLLGDVTVHLYETAIEASKAVLYLCLLSNPEKPLKGIEMGTLYFQGGLALYLGDCFPIPSNVDCQKLLLEKKNNKIKAGEMSLKICNTNMGMECSFDIWVKNTRNLDSILAGTVEKGKNVIRDACRKTRRGERIKIISSGWILN